MFDSEILLPLLPTLILDKIFTLPIFITFLGTGPIFLENIHLKGHFVILRADFRSGDLLNGMVLEFMKGYALGA